MALPSFMTRPSFPDRPRTPAEQPRDVPDEGRPYSFCDSLASSFRGKEFSHARPAPNLCIEPSVKAGGFLDCFIVIVTLDRLASDEPAIYSNGENAVIGHKRLFV